MQYRCPVDDCVFSTQKIDKVPTLEGHPECPGPACRQKFEGYKGAGEVEPIHQPKPQQPSRDHSGAAISPLAPPPAGQGW